MLFCFVIVHKQLIPFLFVILQWTCISDIVVTFHNRIKPIYIYIGRNFVLCVIEIGYIWIGLINFSSINCIYTFIFSDTLFTDKTSKTHSPREISFHVCQKSCAHLRSLHSLSWFTFIYILTLQAIFLSSLGNKRCLFAENILTLNAHVTIKLKYQE